MSSFLVLAIVAVGVVLLVMGVSASGSLSSDISRFFTGKPTDKSLWLIAGGVGCILVGAAGWRYSGGLRDRK